MDNYGYVSFVNRGWLGLANILVDHINTFSKYKIQLFTINCDADFDYPCLIKTRINIPNENFRTICYSKLYASFNNIFDFGLLMDGDIIPLPNIDEIIDSNLKFINYDYPICACHPHSPHKKTKISRNFNDIKSFLGMSHNINKYVYAHYLFSSKMNSFFKECYDIGCYLEERNMHPINADETILNIMLSKIENYEDLGYNYLPNYYAYNDYINGQKESPHFKNYTDYGCKLRFNALHGCKDLEEAKRYSDLIKATKDSFIKIDLFK
jgi:hypothetical protein